MNIYGYISENSFNFSFSSKGVLLQNIGNILIYLDNFIFPKWQVKIVDAL